MVLGTLAAALDREGISTRTSHGNLMFAERIGRAGYEGLNNFDITVQLGEWTFSQTAFRTAIRRARVQRLRRSEPIMLLDKPKIGIADERPSDPGFVRFEVAPMA